MPLHSILPQRKLPSPGFQVEIVLVDYNGNIEAAPRTESNSKKADEESSQSAPSPSKEISATAAAPKQAKDSENQDKDDVFSDNEAEESGSSSKIRRSEGGGSDTKTTTTTSSSADTKSKPDQVSSLTKATEQVSIGNSAGPAKVNASSEPKTTAPGVAASSESDFKAMAADASVFSFGDDEDFESE